MATGLDIAAGVAGLITLADVVLNRTFKTIQACKNAGKESQRLLSEVQSLLGILHGLKGLANEAARGSLESHIPAEVILDCQRTLTAIRDKLAKANPNEAGLPSHKKLLRIFKWPFSASETDNVLKQLERYKGMFDLSLSIETLQSLSCASNEQRQISRGIEDVRKTLDDITRVQITAERQQVLEFFGSFETETNHGTNTNLRMEGTGLWFTKGPGLKTWLSTRNSKLWIYGIPGAGKTVLSAAAIEETMSHASSEYGIAYHYCDYKKPTSRTLARILGSITGQLARQNSDTLSS